MTPKCKDENCEVVKTNCKFYGNVTAEDEYWYCRTCKLELEDTPSPWDLDYAYLS
jgi:hypothetical protein